MLAPWHSTEIFTFVDDTKVEISAGTVRRQSDSSSDPGLQHWVMVKASRALRTSLSIASWEDGHSASEQTLDQTPDQVSSICSLGPLLLAAEASQPVVGGQRTAGLFCPSIPRPKPSRHLQGWLEIPILTNGARSTSQGQTQEVSDTFLIFHSLVVPNSRK